MGCMTFVDSFLERATQGKCPKCGTQVVIQVEEHLQTHLWEQATIQAEISAIEIGKLNLSVRTRRTLAKLNIKTIGELLSASESRIRTGVPISEPVTDEIRQLLASKGLKLPCV